MCLLVISKISGLFVNTTTDDGKYSLPISEMLLQPIQMQLSKKKTFSQSFAAFLKTKATFQHLKKKMTLKAYIFPNLKTAKDVLRKMSKKEN